jgi:hypothetical protein
VLVLIKIHGSKGREVVPFNGPKHWQLYGQGKTKKNCRTAVCVYSLKIRINLDVDRLWQETTEQLSDKSEMSNWLPGILSCNYSFPLTKSRHVFNCSAV